MDLVQTSPDQQFLSESGRAKFPVHWHTFMGKKSVKFKISGGKEVLLKPGDIFGAQEFSKTHDIISFPDNKWRFKLEIPKSEKLMERSVLKKGAKVTIELEPPKPKTEPKVKVVKPINKSKIAKPQKIEIDLTDDELDRKFGARIVEPLDEIDEISDDEIRGLMNSLSGNKKAPKV